MKNKNLILIGGIVLALLIRLVYLNYFPIGITHDELNYIIAAKSLYWTHSFSPGTAPAVLPTTMSNFTVTVAEVPALILAVLLGSFPTTLFASRVVGAVLSGLSVLAVYFIAFHLTKKRSAALICLLLMAINPWSILMGRTIFEVNFFVAFFLWGFLILIKSRGWKILYALPLYLLGFFSYTGGQISFFIYIVITLIYRYFISGRDKKDLIKYIIFFSISALVFLGYVFVATRNQTLKARSGELYLPNQPKIAETVDAERKLAIQTPFNSLFINKATVYFEGFVNKYLNTFSVDTLFLKGELRAAFSYQTHGTFYLIDFLFIIIGLSGLFVTNKKGWMLFMVILIGCSITSGLNIVENSYSQRAGLIYPFLVTLSGLGVATTISMARLKRIKYLLATIIAIIYLVSLANLLHIYFLRFPVYASDGWFFQDRVVSKYINFTKKIFPYTKIFVYTSEPKIVFEEYLFYTNAYNGVEVMLINERLNQKNYVLNDIFFTDICPREISDKNAVVIFDGSFSCDSLTQLTHLVRITRLKDVHENYLIYNDKVCKNLELNRYILSSAYQNFLIEKQSADEFCLNWITKIK